MPVTPTPSTPHITMTTAAPFAWRDLPKVTLHEHIDGCLRPQTLIEMAAERGLTLPHSEPAAVAKWMLDNANSGSLVRYLEGFAFTVQAMATAEACERVSYELAMDAQAEGCVLAEFRMAPQLFEPFGLSAEAATEAMLAGLQRSGLACGLIICGMRHESPTVTAQAARIAVRYQNQGVIGFDLAGPEFGFPPSAHAQAIETALNAGLGLTLHAGEADVGSRVLEAAQLGATRIGHGVNVVRQDDGSLPTWAEQARDRGLHFEVCPSSNVHTGAATSVAAHPIKAMLAAGLSVSCSTDNRLMSATTLCEELEHLHTETGLSIQQLVQMQVDGMKASFLPAAQKAAAMAQLQAWQAANAVV
jgi:adenosine deaminase